MEALDRNGTPIEVGDVVTTEGDYLYAAREITFNETKALVTMGNSSAKRTSTDLERIELTELGAILFDALSQPVKSEELATLEQSITELFADSGTEEGGN